MPTKTICVATHKGGAGKTVTAMALAAALARANKKTLLVDLDPQGHCSLGLGLDINDDTPTLRDIFSEPPLPIGRAVQHTHLERLDIVPSNIRLERVAHALYTRPKREELLSRALKPIYGAYDFVIIDCPPALNVLTETGLSAADLIIVPCQMEARAADGLVDLLEVISILKGESFDAWRILLTKVDSRKSTTNETVMISLSQWKNKMFKTSIPQSEPLNQAQMARTDIFTFDKQSKGALAYDALTEEILRNGK